MSKALTPGECYPVRKCRPSVVSAVKDFKNAAYGESYDEEMADEAALKAKGSAASQKRKASAENASREATQYDWNELADSGKVGRNAGHIYIYQIMGLFSTSC